MLKTEDAEGEILNTICKFEKHFAVKSRNMTGTSLDMIIEIRTAKGGELVRNVMALDAVSSASLLSHDGEATF